MPKTELTKPLPAIEQATGKIDVLLSRNPATALIPVDLQVNVIDTAPQNVEDIAFLKNTTAMAQDLNDLPQARNVDETALGEDARRDDQSAAPAISIGR